MNAFQIGNLASMGLLWTLILLLGMLTGRRRAALPDARCLVTSQPENS